jgi:hypothetical protein
MLVEMYGRMQVRGFRGQGTPVVAALRLASILIQTVYRGCPR